MFTRRSLAYMAIFLALVVLAGCGSQSRPTLTLKQHAQAQSQAAMGSVHPANWGAPVWGPHPGGVAPHAQQLFSMYDAIDINQFSSLNQFALAGYTAGHWPTYLPMRARYPKAHAVSIAIFSVFHADCLDVEPGDAVPAQVVAWVRADMAAGFKKPCVYSSLWMYTNQIRPLLAAAGIPRSSIFEWDADYTFIPHIDPSFDATQWTDRFNGLNADASLVIPAFLSIAQPPYQPGPPPPPRLICFPKPNNAKKCASIIKQVHNRQSAATASQAASAGTQRAIDRLTVRKAMFDQRARYFGGKAAAEIKEYS